MKKELPIWFTQTMQVWYVHPDRLSRRDHKFIGFKFFPSDFKSIEKFHSRIVRDFKTKRKTTWFINHQKLGKFIGFVLTNDSIQYLEFAFNKDRYKIWDFFEYQNRKFPIPKKVKYNKSKSKRKNGKTKENSRED